MNIKYFLSAILLALTLVAKADIICGDSLLMITNQSYSSQYKPDRISIDGFNRMLWQVDSSNFIKIDLSNPGKTCISGSNDCINFYDMDSNEYNAIFVEGTNIMSDSCLKTDIKPLSQGLLSSLNPVTFRWKDNDNLNLSRAVSSSKSSPSDQIHYGFIAQDLKEVLPEAVIEDDFGNFLINYQALIPVIIQELKDLEQKITTQNKEIEDLITELSFYIGDQTINNDQP